MVESDQFCPPSVKEYRSLASELNFLVVSVNAVVDMFTEQRDGASLHFGRGFCCWMY